MSAILRAAVILVPVMAITACQSEGPAERAGESIDNAAARARDTLQPPAGPTERTGRAIDRTVNPGPGERAGRAIDRRTE